MVSSTGAAIDEAQQRKEAHIMSLLESLLESVAKERMFGEFGVTFTAQAGKIGHYEVKQSRSFK